MINNPGSVQCASVSSNLGSGLSCSFDISSRTLTVTGGITSSQVAGSIFQFTISSITNPLSFSPVTVSLKTLTQNGLGIVDTGSATITSTQVAPVDTSSVIVGADDNTVQTYTSFNLQLVNPVALSTGCIITIVFPQQFVFDSSMSVVQGYGLFGSIRDLSYTLDNAQRAVKITDGCQSYKTANQIGKLIFTQVKNPTYVSKSDSFSIYMTDISGFQIAQATTQIFYTPVSGQISLMSLSSDQQQVNKQTTLKVSFTPSSALTAINSLISVTYPSNLGVACNTLSFSGFSQSIKCSQLSTSVLQFSNLFDASYAGDTALAITLQNVLLPFSAQLVSGLKIETFENVIGTSYLVDSTTSTANLLTILPAELLSTSVIPGVFTTYTATTFTFSFITANPIPAGGRVYIQLPSQVTVSSNSDVTSNCKAIKNMNSGLKCAIVTTSDSSSAKAILITNAFLVAVAKEQTFSFSLGGLLTPVSTQTSDTFIVQSQDSNGYTIDKVSSLFSVTMTTGKSVDGLTITSDNYQVGSTGATHTIAFNAPLPLSQSQKLIITLPDDVTPPSTSTLRCSGDGAFQSYQACTISGRIVTVVIQASSTIGYNQQVKISIWPITNPLSTRPTAVYSIQLLDSQNYILSQTSTGSTGTLAMTDPAPISLRTFQPLDTRQQALTTITISFININPIPVGGYIGIKYNDVYIDRKSNAPVWTCTSNVKQSIDCNIPSTNKMTFTNIFINSLPSGQNFTFTMNEMYLSITKKLTTPSWVLTTYTADGYMIDTITSGLSMTFLCNSPCQTCSSSNPSMCTSCNFLTGRTILFNQQCLESCPGGYYNLNGQCLACAAQCKTCTTDNPQICTSCDSASTLYPYLEGNTCTNQCAYGFYGDKSSAQCQKCSSSCLKCEGSSTNCINCGSGKVQYGNQCLDGCPLGFTNPLSAYSNLCVPCDSSCRDCRGEISACTSCNSPNVLSLYDNTCGSSCPSGITVWNSQSATCEVCSSSCLTCSGSPSKCSSCPQNLYLHPASSTCSGSCSSDSTMVAVDGVCQSCASQCLTCQGSQDKCLTCDSKYIFYNYKCVTSCPSGYSVDSKRRCVMDGLICPFGYDVNPQGNACMLKAQICEANFQLNYSKTACIPGPGKYAPYPLLLAAFFLTLIAIASKAKYKNTLLVTNIIAFVSLVEGVGLLVQTILAYQIGLYSTFALTLVALLFHYGCNIFFTLIYLKQVKLDSAFKYWAQNYDITQRVIAGLSGVLNFQFYRMLYCRFFGLDHFNAPFDDPDTYYKPFTFISIFHVVASTLPLIVADVVGLAFIQYGYQIYITCIEMLIIEVFLVALIIYEFIMVKRKLIQSKQYYKVEPKLLPGQDMSVMSGAPDDTIDIYTFKKPPKGNAKATSSLLGTSNSFQQSSFTMGTNQNYSSSQQYSSKYGSGQAQGSGVADYQERRLVLEQLLAQIMGHRGIGERSDKETTEGAIIGLHREELLKRQMRRCWSFRELREVDNDFADADAGDPDLQNFVSCPNSPREKATLHNENFASRMGELRRAFASQSRQFDNVYAESKPTHYFPLRDCKLVGVMTQTSILELLGIDEMAMYRQTKGRGPYEQEEYVEENVEGDFTRDMIGNVLGNLEQLPKKKRIRLPKNRMQQIPNFELSDIVGEFDIDDQGHNVLVRCPPAAGSDEAPKLNDKEGNRVNQRGYLIDIEGNVITNRGVLIFRKDEIDEDGEIPAPFCFEKKKQSLFRVEALTTYNEKYKKSKLAPSDEDLIEREFNKLKEKNMSHRSSVDSLIGETPGNYAGGNSKNKKNLMKQEDSFLNKIVQPMQAKSKHELMKNASKLSTAKKVKDNSRNNNKVTDIDSFQSNNQLNPSASKGIKGLDSSINEESTLGGGGRNNNTSTLHDSNERDLFFSALSAQVGVNKGRPHFVSNGGAYNGGSQSTMSRNGYGQSHYNSSHENTAPFNFEENNYRIQQFKDSLGYGKEDEALQRKLELLEMLEASYQPQKRGGQHQKGNLASKNLARVYGKVKSKLNASSFLRADEKFSTTNLLGLEDDEAQLHDKTSPMIRQKLKAAKLNDGGSGHDSRLKGLENIYLKDIGNRAQSNMSKNRGPLGRQTQNAFRGDGPDVLTDPEELQLQQELAKMKLILSNENSQTTQQVGKKPPRGPSKDRVRGTTNYTNKGISEGGWI